jgi:nitrous oxidase accessory protein NosD
MDARVVTGNEQAGAASRRGHREGRGLQVGKHKDVLTMKNKLRYAFH